MRRNTTKPAWHSVHVESSNRYASQCIWTNPLFLGLIVALLFVVGFAKLVHNHHHATVEAAARNCGVAGLAVYAVGQHQRVDALIEAAETGRATAPTVHCGDN